MVNPPEPVTTTLAVVPEGSPVIEIDKVPTAVTATFAEPKLVESCTDVAVMVAVPADAGVKIPALFTLPTLEGLADQLTELLKLPVPVTVGVQVDV